MNKLPWIVGGILVLCLSSLLFARYGVVVTIDGKRIEGEITDKGTDYEVLTRDKANPAKLVPAKLGKGAVKDIIYSDQVADQVKQQLATLPKNDVAGRLTLANYAKDNGAWDAAKDVLDEAKVIEPNNKDVNAMLETVNARVHLMHPDRPLTTTKPVTPEAAAPATTSSSLAPKRLVTPDEINHIKQIEWNKTDPMQARIDPAVIDRYTAGKGISKAEFAKLSKDQQAAQILTDGKPDLAAGVHLIGDPIQVAHYKIMQPALLAGCGASGCHVGPTAKGGNFVLFQGDQAAQIYTNFLTLQTFTKQIDKTPMPLVDRQNPDSSLLLEYMLPPDVAKVAHPPTTPAYKGTVKTKSDVRFQRVAKWISDFSGIQPTYGIDLTTDPPKK